MKNDTVQCLYNIFWDILHSVLVPVLVYQGTEGNEKLTAASLILVSAIIMRGKIK